ncbi:MAG: sugar transferase [Silvibacterium sp.]
MTEKQHPPISLLKLFDLMLVALSFGLTTALLIHAYGKISLAPFLSMRMKISNFLIFGLAMFLCHLMFCICGQYRSRRLSSRRAELMDVSKATTLSALCLLAIGSAFSVRMITPQFLAAFWLVSTTVLCASRLLLRIVLAQFRVRGRNLRHMLILGTNPRAIEFALRIDESSERGYHILGFVDNDWQGLLKFKATGFELVSDCDGLAEFLRRNVVDEVANFLPVGSFYRHFSEVANLCEQQGIIVRFNPDIFGLKRARWHAEEFGGKDYIATYAGADEGWPFIVKRTFDIIISSLLLVLSAPLMIGVALAIKWTSPGPVFFLQERLGINKRLFRVFKFRTMVPDAEKLMPKLVSKNEVSGPVFKIKDDPRITSIGKFLRRSSIDELPQLLNVLKGDMSLVGPRPLPVRDYEGFSEDWQRRRFSVKPGITCLWQVNGRSDISFDRWMLLDLQYMDEWSLWLDMKILAKTIPAVMKGSGAA